MPAYVLAWTILNDADGRDAMARYGAAMPAILASYGGKYRFVGPGIEVLEGDWDGRGLVVLEFPTRADAMRWYESDDYAPWRKLRQQVARTTLLCTPDAPAPA